MIRILNILASANRTIGRLCVILAGILMALMTMAVILQVISREMRSPIGWTEELALAAMVWLAFLIGPWAYRNHQMTRIDVFYDMLSKRRRQILTLVIHCFEAVVLLFVCYLSWAFFLRGTAMLPALSSLLQDVVGLFIGPDDAKGLRVPNSAIYVVLPLGFGAMLLVNLELLLRAAATLLSKRDFGLVPESLSARQGGADRSLVDVHADDANGRAR